MKAPILRAITCLMVICLFALLPHVCKKITHGFRPAKCILEWPENPQWETEPLGSAEEQEIRAILAQPFSYFSKGKQCFVFLSQDQTHVLKLFRFDVYEGANSRKSFDRIKTWLRAKDLPLLDAEATKVLSSCKMAFERASDLTGLVYVHLNPKERSFLPILQVKDRWGRTHRLDPAVYRFILQMKCDPLMPTLLSADPEKRNELLSSFSVLMERFGDLGFKNIDTKLLDNYGFIKGKAVAIDVGNYVYDPIQAKEDKAFFIQRLDRSLEKKLKENGSPPCSLE
jgi:hypothetical protein